MSVTQPYFSHKLAVSQLANGVSVLRLVVTPVIVWLLLKEYDREALSLFVVAALSDLLDGFLARHFAGVSRMGAVLDSLADKVMLMAVYVTLGMRGLLPEWVVILVVLRDFMMMSVTGLTILLWRRLPPIEPVILSKINTVMQILLVMSVLAGLVVMPLLGEVTILLMGFVALTTISSGGVYCGRWFHRLARF